MRKSIRSKAASANLMVAVLAAIASYYAWEMFLNEGDSVKAFIGLSLLMMTTVSSSSLYIIQKSIIDPLLLMGEEIWSLNPDNLPVKRLSCGGEDEIAGLADEINKMLSRIEEGNQDLREKNKQLQMVLDGGNIGFWDFQIPSGALYVSKKPVRSWELIPGMSR